MDMKLIQALIKWKLEGNRRVDVPIEYLLEWPEKPKIWCMDMEMNDGDFVSCEDDLNKIDCKGKRIKALRAELDRLEGI